VVKQTQDGTIIQRKVTILCINQNNNQIPNNQGIRTDWRIMEPNGGVITSYISGVRTEPDEFNVKTKGNLGYHNDPLDLVTSLTIRGIHTERYLDWVG
jgi:hypothetical protein